MRIPFGRVLTSPPFRSIHPVLPTSFASASMSARNRWQRGMLVIQERSNGKLIACAISMAVVFAATAGMAVLTMDDVRNGAASPFAMLLWSVVAAVSGLACVALALAAFLRGKSRGAVGSR